jgi:hypothetical protein
MSRTDSRMQMKLATNATKKQNSGNRPVCTICAWNQPDTITPAWQACRCLTHGRMPRYLPSLSGRSRCLRLAPVLGSEDDLNREPLAHAELAGDLGGAKALLVIKEREPLLRLRPRCPGRRRRPVRSRSRSRPCSRRAFGAASGPRGRRPKSAAPLIAVFPIREFRTGLIIKNKEFLGRLILTDGHHGEAFCVYLLALRCHAVIVFLSPFRMQVTPARNALSH